MTAFGEALAATAPANSLNATPEIADALRDLGIDPDEVGC